MSPLIDASRQDGKMRHVPKYATISAVRVEKEVWRMPDYAYVEIICRNPDIISPHRLQSIGFF